MDPKSNPFLMDDFPSEVDAAGTQASNPFLQNFGDPSAAEIPSSGDANPFLSFVPDSSYQPPGDATNPFASFGIEPVSVTETATEAYVSPEEHTVPQQEPEPLISIEPNTTSPVTPPKTPSPPHPVSEQSTPSKPSRPPPPPRPGPPPPPVRNPKDMILSVTGAMDQTSNQMLDRLQATKTPSPTLMHSPSPTPEQGLAEMNEAEGSIPVTQNMPEMPEEVAASDNTAVHTTRRDSHPHSDSAQKEVDHKGIVSHDEVNSMPDQMEVPSSRDENVKIVESTPVEVSMTAETTAPTVPTRGGFADLLGGYGSVEPIPDSMAAISPAVPHPPTTYSSRVSSSGFAEKTGGDAFDAFASKFEKAAEHDTHANAFGDPFGGGSGGGGGSIVGGQTAMDTSSDVWGDSGGVSGGQAVSGFGEGDDGFDSFLSMTAPPPELERKRRGSDEAPDFSVYIKPRDGEQGYDGGPVPTIGPPPKSPMHAAYSDSSQINPFDRSGFAQEGFLPSDSAIAGEMKRSDSQETPPTPLFDEDVSQPLEDFPRIHYSGEGWEMHLRMPLKKKITGQRFWKKIFAKLVYQGDSPVLQLFNKQGEKDPFQELPLLACYSVSEIAAQQFDQYGKIFTVKLQYIFYKERPGVRPGQVTKAGRITNKLSQFAAYAIQGDYEGVKEFGSDLKKLGLPVEHAPQASQLFKLGSQDYEEVKQFSVIIEEALFKLPAHRDRALQYKMEEVQISVVDELYVEQRYDGHVEKQIARVRLFFLGFLSGMPDVELGINDIHRQGKEVVGRHDIIPVATEEWIRLEKIEFHSCVQQDEYEKTKLIKFKPPDACYIELMRFRVRPPRNRELPLQLKVVMCVTGNKVEIRSDILVPGFASRKLGRVPCEDVMVRIPIPECWIYLFRVEKHFRYGSVKSAHRRTGKIKGIERLLGTMESMEPQLMEATSGQAKYEHQHHAIVWRISRLPKEGQGAYTTHQLVCRLSLTSYDQIPDKLAEYAYVDFTMPVTQASHTTARSVSFQNFDSDEPPEKYVRNLSRHEYRVEIEHTQGESVNPYLSATSTTTPKKSIPESVPEAHEETQQPAASDSDSSD